MKPELNVDIEALTPDQLQSLPKKGEKTIVGQAQKTEYNAKKKAYVTRTYNFFNDGSEECIDDNGVEATW